MKIAVIEDHTLMRELLVKACREGFPEAVVAGAPDAASGLRLVRRLKPDVAILDLGLPDRHGLDLVDELLEAQPALKVIGLSGSTDEFTVHRTARSRLHGFVDKGEQTIEALLKAVTTVLAGQRYLSSRIREALRSLREDPASFDKILSEREQDLLRLFGRGLTNEQVAAQVGLSELTVRNYRCRVMAKLQVRTSAELIRYALEKGFVGPAAGRPAPAG